MPRLVLIYYIGILSNTFPGYGNSDSYGRARSGRSGGGRSGSGIDKGGGGGAWWFDGGQSQTRGSGRGRYRDDTDEGGIGGHSETNDRYGKQGASRETRDGYEGYISRDRVHAANDDGGKRHSANGIIKKKDSSDEWASSQDKYRNSNSGRGYNGHGSKVRERDEDGNNERGYNGYDSKRHDDSNNARNNNHGGRDGYSDNDHESNGKYSGRGSSSEREYEGSSRNSNGKDGGAGPWWFNGAKIQISDDKGDPYSSYIGNPGRDKGNNDAGRNEGAWWFNGGRGNLDGYKVSTTKHENYKKSRESEKDSTHNFPSDTSNKQTTRSDEGNIRFSDHSVSEEREVIPDGLKDKLDEIIDDQSGSGKHGVENYLRSKNKSNSVTLIDPILKFVSEERVGNNVSLRDPILKLVNKERVRTPKISYEKEQNVNHTDYEESDVAAGKSGDANNDGVGDRGIRGGNDKGSGVSLTRSNKSIGKSKDLRRSSEDSNTRDHSENRDDFRSSGEHDRSDHEKKEKGLKDSGEHVPVTAGLTWDKDYGESGASEETRTRSNAAGEGDDRVGSPQLRSRLDTDVVIKNRAESDDSSALGDMYRKLVEKLGS